MAGQRPTPPSKQRQLPGLSQPHHDATKSDLDSPFVYPQPLVGAFGISSLLSQFFLSHSLLTPFRSSKPKHCKHLPHDIRLQKEYTLLVYGFRSRSVPDLTPPSPPFPPPYRFITRMHSSDHERLSNERKLNGSAISSGIDPVTHAGMRRGSKASLPRRREAGALHPLNPHSPIQPASRRSSGASTQGKLDQGLTAFIVHHQIRMILCPCPPLLLSDSGTSNLPRITSYTRNFSRTVPWPSRDYSQVLFSTIRQFCQWFIFQGL